MLRGRRSPPPVDDAPPSPRSSEYGADDADDGHDGAAGGTPGGDEGASGGGGGWVRGGGSFADGCAECGEPSVDAKLQADFGVRLCRVCSRLPAHALVTKSDARSVYLLSDAALKPLRFRRRRNASYSRDGETHLYLASQLAAASAQRFGGEEELAAERDRRRDARLERAAKKRRAAAAAAAAGDPDAVADEAVTDAVAAALLGPGHAAARRKGPAAPPRAPPAKVRALAQEHAPHAHSYAGPPQLDAASGEHRRVCTTCGAVSVVELM